MRFLPALILLVTTNLFAAAPEGVPRELARERAAMVSDLRYQVHFTLTPHAHLSLSVDELNRTVKIRQTFPK